MAKVRDDKQVKGVSPAGIAVYPKLNSPDTKFNDNGVYTTKLKLTEKEAEPLIKLIDGLIETEYNEAVDNATTPAAKKRVKKADAPYRFEEDDDANPTGYVLFNFKRVASGTTKDGKKWAFTCPVYDAKLKPIDLTKNIIGGGSIIKVAYAASPFNVPALGVGVSMRLEAVQVLEIRTYGQKDGVGFGFGVVDGYDSVEQEDAVAAQFNEDEGDIDDSGDF